MIFFCGRKSEAEQADVSRNKILKDIGQVFDDLIDGDINAPLYFFVDFFSSFYAVSDFDLFKGFVFSA